MKVKFFLLDTDYITVKDTARIRLWGKTEEGKNAVVFAQSDPYFYVLPSDVKKAKDEIEKILKGKKAKIKNIEEVKKKLNGEFKKFLKIICFRPQDTQKIRDFIKVLEAKRGGSGSVIEEYEYAINFYRRFLISNRIDGNCWLEIEGEKINTNYNVDLALNAKKINILEDIFIPQLNILAFDIETVEIAGKKKIVMASFYGKDFKKVLTDQRADYPKWVYLVKDEKELLQEIVKTFNTYNPDIIVTYYGDSFDFQVLNERCQINKVKLVISRDKTETKFTRRARISSARLNGIVHIDIFNFINNILSPGLQTEVLTLDAVSSEILGDKKIEIDYQEMLEAWHKGKNLTKLAEYCLKDSELTYRLAEILLPQAFEISRIVGQIIFDISRMTYGQLVEWYLSRKADEKNEIIPNQPKFEEILKRKRVSYVGGFVKEPIPGIHENISVLDFRSLYPSLIVSFNISPETFNCECCKEDGHKVPELNYWFCNKKEGFVPSVVKELIKKRIELKKKLKEMDKSSLEYRVFDNRQYALKIIANATYGYFGFAGSKWYSKECAESCTAFGRYWIKQAIKEAENKGFTVIYADTDSLFLKTKNGDIEKVTESFLDYINKKFPGILELDLQGYYERGIFIPKGAAPGTAKKRYALVDKKGELLIRGLETVRRDWCNLAKEVQRKVLEFVLKEKDVEKAKDYVKEIVAKVKGKEILLRDLIIYEELTKPLESYKQIGPHVMAARKIKERGGEVGEGMLIMFVITKGAGSISERAEPVEFASLEQIDSDYYIYHQIIPAALRVLQVLGVRETDFNIYGEGKII
ncbi:MAG: DNA-directed DNA polymerase [Candidatus Desulfofervidus auxilii]|nr:DNA-directed DNA polymerase [Candidatus Desulfofervidus auxilii]